MTRYVHAVTGREIEADGPRTAGLVDADDAWSEVKPKGRRVRKKADAGSDADSEEQSEQDD